MKKLLILALAIVTLGSCSSSSGNPTTEAPNAIIGSWKLTSVTEGATELIDDCSKKTTLVASENMSVAVKFYSLNNTVCELNSATGSWRVANNVVIIKDSDGIDNTVSFSNNNATFSYTQSSYVYTWTKG